MSAAVIASDDAGATIDCLMLCIVNPEVVMPVPTDALSSKQVSNTERRATPELIEFYRKRAHELRAEAIRSGISDVWSLLLKMMRFHSRSSAELRSPFWGTR